MRLTLVIASLSLALASCTPADGGTTSRSMMGGSGMPPTTQPPTTQPPTTQPPTTQPPVCPPPKCTDPEKEAGSYVSIGTMPAPYPINWQSPFTLFVTTLGTAAASAGLDRSHSIGHVLLKVRCGTDEPIYISQTGANGKEAGQFWSVYKQGPSYLFHTNDDGKLYTDAEAKADWESAVKLQEELVGGTYTTDPDVDKLPGKIWYLKGMGDVKTAVRDLAPAVRHRFVRATIRITEAQCRAIISWRDDYVRTGGATRYAVHRAPWVMDTHAKYDGGGCASVGFAGAFYATGLNYKNTATRVTERVQIGTARLPYSLPAHNGWFNLQNPGRYVPGAVSCATHGGDACYSTGISWSDDLWKNWSGGMYGPLWDKQAKDDEGEFSKTWQTHRPVKARTVPLIVFEPERFYAEVMARWNNPNYDAFKYPDWCKLEGKVPTIVLDGRNRTGAGEVGAGRPRGIINGFANVETMLPNP
ncbi:MAG: hypothetical protein IPL61_13065 [Myxococcales bacterium]|nr:hypothetical protein [Myxococcales bacterium]